ncbi:GNAT family N-acetyltransferase [Paenibacillus sp. SC116]|uniref:GNAT family N-acetyltransferase n=1 Tax=Paenibacillus sp. SC116 TaxID=2968986 RepID=UPI00215A55BE|nr:GNAT family N-acetyltransferase [Paenibacillus sp. SC116]MCR8843054.1 GNAT family N-acetyltransferase [Paenibacillus sp. SC116]
MDLLSDTLQSITGDSGKNSFDLADVCVPRSIFVIARNQDGEPIGCGAIRPIDNNTAELKRMFAKLKSHGVGSAILNYLENRFVLDINKFRNKVSKSKSNIVL